MRELPANTHALWVYDTQTGTWQKEAAEPVRFFAGTGSDLYFACENGFIHSIRGSGLWYDPAKVIATRLCLQETGFAWSAETGPVSLDMPERQHLTRVNLRYRLKVWARLETDDAWRLLYQTSAACAEKTVSMPAPPGRSSSFYLKIEGSGACAIMALSESYEAGSDV